MLSYGDLFSLSRAGEFGSRPCQNMRGDAVLLYGEEATGDESCLDKLLDKLFCINVSYQVQHVDCYFD